MGCAAAVRWGVQGRCGGASWRGYSNPIPTLIFFLYFGRKVIFMGAKAGPLVEENDEVPSLWTKLPEMAMVNSVL